MKRPCLHCNKREREPWDALCSNCSKYPKCKGCGIIFGEMIAKQSAAHPEICDSCLEFDKFVKYNCVKCGVEIPLFAARQSTKLNYEVRGNFCPTCSAIAKKVSRAGLKKTSDKRFSGYLDILNNQVERGKLTQGLFDEAVESNPQDITNSLPELTQIDL